MKETSPSPSIGTIFFIEESPVMYESNGKICELNRNTRILVLNNNCLDPFTHEETESQFLILKILILDTNQIGFIPFSNHFNWKIVNQ